MPYAIFFFFNWTRAVVVLYIYATQINSWGIKQASHSEKKKNKTKQKQKHTHTPPPTHN